MRGSPLGRIHTMPWCSSTGNAVPLVLLENFAPAGMKVAKSRLQSRHCCVCLGDVQCRAKRPRFHHRHSTAASGGPPLLCSLTRQDMSA